MFKQRISTIFKNKQNTNLIIYGIGQAFNLITPLLVVPYIVSICGVENFGKTSIAMAVSFFMIVFIDYGSDIIGVKDVAVNRDNKDELEKTFITTISSKVLCRRVNRIIRHRNLRKRVCQHCSTKHKDRRTKDRYAVNERKDRSTKRLCDDVRFSIYIKLIFIFN